ncbi:MAG: sce7725 family protein [Bacteroidetes bacterium]|nr:sce7725 family protein [Bacteroidota bacterium]
MYYPYLRGKQFELILLRDNAGFLAKNNIHPIIEPVKSDFAALTRAMKALNENSVDCTLIVNPGAGQEPVPSSSILAELIEDKFKKFKNISIGYILHAESKIDHLVALLKKHRKLNFSILHYGYTNGKKLADAIDGYENIKTHIFIDGFAGKLYQRHLKRDGIKRVLIRDGFKAQKKNAHYPPSEHFSDLHITFPDEGMDGFGDYLIVGDDYTETGGPAYAVAIHLTYLDDDDMFIYHFISDQTDSPTDPGGKFLEALAKLEKKVNKPKSLIFKSSACTEYLKLYKKQHYPGLGYVKKLSMQHHVELMANFISRDN